MDLPDLAKIRRLTLTIAALIVALVIAQVQLKTPLEIAPLGIPMVIARPDMLTVALVLAVAYSTIRYIYYGMFVRRSPMRARYELMNRTHQTYAADAAALDKFRERAEADINRLFPHVGNVDIKFEIVQSGHEITIRNFAVPTRVRVLCWIENADFLFPVFASAFAIILWFWTTWNAS